ncbi:VOC family protein [Rhodovibrionaceae bacterium A322]
MAIDFLMNHVSLGCKDVKASGAFYDAIMEPLGAKRIFDFDFAVAYGRKYPEFWVTYPENEEPATVGNGAHFCFTAESNDQVDAFYAAALAAGGTDCGKPGLRPYAENYYAAFVLDLDGNKLEAVCMPLEG